MNYNILIIDDKEDVFEKYKSALKGYPNLSLRHVKHGPAAIEMIKQNQIHLIFLDQIFSDESIAVNNLYWINEEQQIVTCNNEEERRYLRTHIDRQGLYILQKLREEGYKQPIIFVTAVADNREIDKIWGEVEFLGANNYLPKSDGLTEAVLISHIKRYLNIPELYSVRQEISFLIDEYKINTTNEYYKNSFINILKKEAESRRRMGIPFVKEVIKEVSKENYISIGTFSEVRKRISNKDEWQFEEINPKELLEWVLSRCARLKVFKAQMWDYEGTNGVRYGYRYEKGHEVFYLRIVHPKYTNDIQNFDDLKAIRRPTGYFEWVDLGKCELERNDPYWQGNHIIIYLEKGNDGVLIKEYVSEKAPLDSKDIKEILEKTKTIICASEPEWHGAISIESIYIKETIAGEFGHLRNVTISDYLLYNLLNVEGRNAIKGLTLSDKKKRDIQALGFIGNFLTSGISGEDKSSDFNDEFLKFLMNCSEGSWNLNQDIPELTINALYFHNGPYISIIEREFSSFLKKQFIENKINALVYFNTSVRLGPYIGNEVDALVVRHNRIFWLDTKGEELLMNEDYRNVQIDKINKIKGYFRDLLLNKMKVDKDFIIGYCVLKDALYDRIIKEGLSITEKDIIRSFSQIINEIKNEEKLSDTEEVDLDKFRKKFNDLKLFFKRYESPYESSIIFKQDYGTATITIIEGEKILAELNCNERPYYIRRYSLDHSYDSVLEVQNLRDIINNADKENSLIGKISCEYILIPEKILFIDSQNERTNPFKKTEDGEKYINPDIRWIYKVYKKPDKDFGCPLQLKYYSKEITEDKKVKLLCHYLKACNDLLNSKCNLHFDSDSLKIFKSTKENEYVGVIEPILKETIRKEDILIIFDVLDDGKETLTSLRRKVSEAKNANSVLGELINTLTELIHHKEKYEEVQKTLGKLSGTVKWFNDKKGFGFISQDNGDDIFVHQTSIQGEGFRTLAEGDKVEFEIIKDEKGNKAANVVKV